MAAIIFTTAIAVVLISTGDLSTLADTTVVLLLTVFTIVNVAVLVLRRASRSTTSTSTRPSVFPVLGALIAVALLIDTALDDAAVLLRALILLAVGAALWVVNRLVAGPPEEGLDAERLRAG